jgi:hypothetical protein
MEKMTLKYRLRAEDVALLQGDLDQKKKPGGQGAFSSLSERRRLSHLLPGRLVCWAFGGRPYVFGGQILNTLPNIVLRYVLRLRFVKNFIKNWASQFNKWEYFMVLASSKAQNCLIRMIAVNSGRYCLKLSPCGKCELN